MKLGGKKFEGYVGHYANERISPGLKIERGRNFC